MYIMRLLWVSIVGYNVLPYSGRKLFWPWKVKEFCSSWINSVTCTRMHYNKNKNNGNSVHWSGNSQRWPTAIYWIFVSWKIVWLLVDSEVRSVLTPLWRSCVVSLSSYFFFICREFPTRVANQETYLFCLRVMVSWLKRYMKCCSH